MNQQTTELLTNGGIDLAATISRFAGNEGLFLKFLRRFPTDATYEALCKAMSAQDLSAASDACHTLKGVAGNLGLAPLYEACITMMTACRAGDWPCMTTGFDGVRQKYQQRVEMITALPE